MSNGHIGPPEFVLVKGRDDVGTVIQAGTNIGQIRCFAVLFESTGEVTYYKVSSLTRCDAAGNPQTGPSESGEVVDDEWIN